jgi:hypothetical protein
MNPDNPNPGQEPPKPRQAQNQEHRPQNLEGATLRGWGTPKIATGSAILYPKSRSGLFFPQTPAEKLSDIQWSLATILLASGDRSYTLTWAEHCLCETCPDLPLHIHFGYRLPLT